MDTITLSLGQVVHWPHASDGIAQIDELRRKRVRIVYRTKRGATRFAIVTPAAITAQTWMPGIHNALDRGVLKRSRQYPPRKCEGVIHAPRDPRGVLRRLRAAEPRGDRAHPQRRARLGVAPGSHRRRAPHARSASLHSRLSHVQRRIRCQIPPPNANVDGESREVIAMPKPDVLKRMLRESMTAGGDWTEAEHCGDAINEMAWAVAVIQLAPQARRILGLVMSGKPLCFKDGRFTEVPKDG